MRVLVIDFSFSYGESDMAAVVHCFVHCIFNIFKKYLAADCQVVLLSECRENSCCRIVGLKLLQAYVRFL